MSQAKHHHVCSLSSLNAQNTIWEILTQSRKKSHSGLQSYVNCSVHARVWVMFICNIILEMTMHMCAECFHMYPTYIELELSGGGSRSCKGLPSLRLCFGSGVGEGGPSSLVLSWRVHGPASIHHWGTCATPHGWRKCKKAGHRNRSATIPFGVCLVYTGVALKTPQANFRMLSTKRHTWVGF